MESVNYFISQVFTDACTTQYDSIQHLTDFYTITNKGTQPCLGPLEKVILEKGFFRKRGWSALRLLAPTGGLRLATINFGSISFDLNDYCNLALLFFMFSFYTVQL